MKVTPQMSHIPDKPDFSKPGSVAFVHQTTKGTNTWSDPDWWWSGHLWKSICATTRSPVDHCLPPVDRWAAGPV